MSVMIYTLRFRIMFVIMMFLFFLRFIFFFPSRNNNFFLLSSQVDGLTTYECFIQFLDIFSGNIVFSMSRKVSLHDTRERIYEDIERLTIIFCFTMMAMRFFRMLLNKGNDYIRISRTIERELISS